MLRHDSGAPSQNDPGQQRAEKSIPNADPSGGNAEFPAELPGITNKDYSGEVRCTVGKCGEPGADAAAAEYKAIYIGGVFSAIKADTDHNDKKGQ